MGNAVAGHVLIILGTSFLVNTITSGVTLVMIMVSMLTIVVIVLAFPVYLFMTMVNTLIVSGGVIMLRLITIMIMTS